MARAIWSGSISFGLVSVPVKVFSAVSTRDVRFSQLHGEDGGRIQYKRVCSVDGEEVPFDQIVKGYEIGPDEYVVVRPEELEALDPESTRRIDIEDFVELAEIDPLHYDKSYWLMPNTGGSKAYRVLLDAMQKEGKVAIGRVVLRTRQYLVALRAADGALVMSTLNYADELVRPESLDGMPDAGEAASERELRMAQQLIETLTDSFHPERYRDEYRDRVLALVEAKAEGREVVTAPTPDTGGEVLDLMAALERSLKAGRTSHGGHGSKDEPAAAATPAKVAAADKPKRGKRAQVNLDVDTEQESLLGD
jgi:DNA end-binding protein Ku